MDSIDDHCAFCAIANAYPPCHNGVPKNPDPELIMPNCFLLLSTEKTLAFLDILPITDGHVLVISRQHKEKLGDLCGSEGAALGWWLPVVSRAVMRALGKADGDWNVVQNNGAMAAQAVPHVHYHIIPRLKIPELKAQSWTMFGRGQRQELDDDEAAKLAQLIREELSKDLESMELQDKGAKKILEKL